MTSLRIGNKTLSSELILVKSLGIIEIEEAISSEHKDFLPFTRVVASYYRTSFLKRIAEIVSKLCAVIRANQGHGCNSL